jgi:hypothetical protein
MFDWLFKLLGFRIVPTIVSNLESDEPTGGDKPTPHSSLTLSQALKIAELVSKKATQYTKKNNNYFTIKNTNSMEWLIDSNTVVVAEEVTSNTPLKVGDVVIYNGEGSPLMPNTQVMHRITKTLDDEYYIKGDNNKFGDGWINKKWISWRAYTFINARQQTGTRKND